ncbi:MAG: hypothetical protein RLZZ628_2953 [Bacteroidota bacterium]|jgi:spermidine synthase
MRLSFPINRTARMELEVKSLLISQKTPYHKIEIWETSHYGKLVLCNEWLQSIEYDDFIYDESLVHPAFNMTNSPFKNILIIGGSQGGILREVLKYKSVEKITMVDIDADFIKISKEYLACMHKGSFDDIRVRFIFEDGRKYLESCEERYDAIIVGLTAPEEHCPSVFLYTLEWYSLVSKCLTNEGVLSVLV